MDAAPALAKATPSKYVEESEEVEALDDPVQKKKKKKKKVKLLTREQEVEISKRIEEAEQELKEIIYAFGFTAKEHIALTEKLLCDPPKERFDRAIQDNKIPTRESHMRALRRL